MLTTDLWGTTPEGRDVYSYTLANATGLSATFGELGATTLSILQPDRTGISEEVTLGFPDLASALAPSPYFGSTIGRYANRIANASFALGERGYELPANNGAHTLHGGPDGFHMQIWEAAADNATVRFRLHSPDGHAGFPGNLAATVTVTMSELLDGAPGGELHIDYEAVTDQPTPVNLTNHTYFNLAGLNAADLSLGAAPTTVEDHLLRVNADQYLPVDSTCVPVGEPASVTGTAMDLRRPMPLAVPIHSAEPQLTQFGGLDHNFALATASIDDVAAELQHPGSGRRLRIRTTKPGLQVYTGNGLDGNPWPRHGGVALETQFWPDAPNRADFASSILQPGEIYRHTTVLTFDAAR